LVFYKKPKDKKKYFLLKEKKKKKKKNLTKTCRYEPIHFLVNLIGFCVLHEAIGKTTTKACRVETYTNKVDGI